MSDCLVSERDYLKHFKGVDVEQSAPAWDGTEHRIGPKDRRSTRHERRWESSRGRRFRLIGRRYMDRVEVAAPRTDARAAQRIIDSARVRQS